MIVLVSTLREECMLYLLYKCSRQIRKGVSSSHYSHVDLKWTLLDKFQEMGCKLQRVYMERSRLRVDESIEDQAQDIA